MPVKAGQAQYAITALDAAKVMDDDSDQTVSRPFQSRDEALAWLEREHDNLIATIGRVSGRTHTTESPASSLSLARAWLLTFTCSNYLRLRYQFDELLLLAETSLKLARQLDDVSAESSALLALGEAQRRTGQPKAAQSTFQQLGQLARDQRDQHLEAETLAQDGDVWVQLRRFDDAFAAYDAAKALFHELGEPISEAAVLDSIGRAHAEMRAWDKAAAAYRAATALCKQAGSRRSEAAALVNLSGVLGDWGRLQEAVEASNAALALYQQLGGNAHGEAAAWHNIGKALGKSKEFRRSDAVPFMLRRAVTGYRATGDDRGTARALNSLGVALARAQRSRQEAVAAHEEAVELFYKAHDRHGAAKAWCALSLDLRKLGRFKEAINAAQHGVDEFHSIGDPVGESDALVFLGVALAYLRRLEDAAAAFMQVRDINREIGNTDNVGFANSMITAAQKKQRWRILLAATTLRVA